MQAGNFSRINKRAGGNNAVQVGIFQNSLVKNHKKWKKIEKSINVQEVIRACRLEIFKKIIICAARLLDTLEYSNFKVRQFRFRLYIPQLFLLHHVR